MSEVSCLRCSAWDMQHGQGAGHVQAFVPAIVFLFWEALLSSVPTLGPSFPMNFSVVLLPCTARAFALGRLS